MKQNDNSQELQKTLNQLETGRRQLESIAKQSQMVENALLEINATIQALNALDEVKEGTGILVSMGANTFVKASLTDKENILVGIGAGFSAEKKRGDAIKSLESRKDEMSRALESMRRMASEIESKLLELNAIAEGMVGRAKQ